MKHIAKLFVLPLFFASTLLSVSVFAGGPTLVPDPNAYAPKIWPYPPANQHWVFGVGAAYDSLSLDHQNTYLVNNVAGNPPDVFTLINPTFDSVFYNFSINSQWNGFVGSAPSLLTLGLEYDLSDKSNINENRVVQQSAPSGVDSYSILREAWMLMAKVNVGEWHHVRPVVQTGFGLAANKFYNFVDTLGSSGAAMTPFPNNTYDQFAYAVGFGIDWHFLHNLYFSAGYRYMSWGDMKSGDVNQGPNNSGPLPAPIHLEHELTSNAALFSLNYVFSR